MGDGFTITAVESKGNADLLFVVAANFEAVRTPTQVRVLHGNTAVMATAINVTCVPLEKQAEMFFKPVAISGASLRISPSIVFLPNRRCSSYTWF